MPILKFFDRHGGLEVDLSVNNPTSIRNTHMLFCYSQVSCGLWSQFSWVWLGMTFSS